MRTMLPVLRHDRGFTLAEVIIVIFILALVSGVLLLRAAATSPVKVAERAARELHSYLIVAKEQAILQPAVLGLSLSKEGYQILELQDTDEQSWVPLKEKARFWQAHKFDRNIQLTLFVNQQQVSIPNLLNSSTSVQISFLPSGEMTPFDLLIQYQGQDFAYKIRGNFAGQLDLTEVQ